MWDSDQKRTLGQAGSPGIAPPPESQPFNKMCSLFERSKDIFVQLLNKNIYPNHKEGSTTIRKDYYRNQRKALT